MIISFGSKKLKIGMEFESRNFPDDIQEVGAEDVK
jgi:hypothetical protein